MKEGSKENENVPVDARANGTFAPITILHFFLWRCEPTRVMASSFFMFLDHTQRRSTVGRTPLDE